ncbi:MULTISPECIES: hypothetical protein [Anaerolinea]|uniref:hypothetical protein n=1 Tax=Anaerolinea TaxID=233189 RepID=UPI00260A0D51|nr:hypothetical protein [Anaerolinea thermophila]
MNNNSRAMSAQFRSAISRADPSVVFLVMILGALVAFEIFNYSTTDHALRDLLGDLKFGGMYWSTILAIAFCGIDFAGIARLFTPEQGADEPREIWYLFGAWLLAATMNAILTWWGVSMAITNHKVQSAAVINPKTIATVVPIFVAIMVWVIRVLIIGTLTVAMDRVLRGESSRSRSWRSTAATSAGLPTPAPLPTAPSFAPRPTPTPSLSRSAAPTSRASSSASFSAPAPAESAPIPEPTYHSLSMSGRASSAAPVGSRPAQTPTRRL